MIQGNIATRAEGGKGCGKKGESGRETEDRKKVERLGSRNGREGREVENMSEAARYRM